MIRISRQVWLTAKPDAVFEFLADFENLPQWDPGIVEAGRVGPADAAPEVGTEYEVVSEFMGRRVPLTYRTTKYDADARKAELVGQGDAFEGVDRIHIEKNGSDGCTVHWEADFTMVGLARLGEPLLRPVFSRLADKAMSGLASRFS